MQGDVIKLENEFARAVTSNDVDALDGILADDWIIIDPDGSIVDKCPLSRSYQIRCFVA